MAFVAGVATQTTHKRIDQEAQRSSVAVIERDLATEGFVRLPAPSVDLSDLVGQQVPVPAIISDIAASAAG